MEWTGRHDQQEREGRWKGTVLTAHRTGVTARIRWRVQAGREMPYRRYGVAGGLVVVCHPRSSPLMSWLSQLEHFWYYVR